jgi:hypothetical protein
LHVAVLPARCLLPRTQLQIVRFTAQRTMCANIPVGETAKSSADVLRAKVVKLLYIHLLRRLIYNPEAWVAGSYCLQQLQISETNEPPVTSFMDIAQYI